jgi:hypothetical protein
MGCMVEFRWEGIQSAMLRAVGGTAAKARAFPKDNAGLEKFARALVSADYRLPLVYL